MDEASWQLLHEYRHAMASHMIDMASEVSSSTTKPASSSSTPPPSAAEDSAPRKAVPPQVDVHTQAKTFMQAQARDHNQSSMGHVSRLFPPMTPTQALQQSLAMGRFSDLTIVHGETVWTAHKVIVCSQSPVLEARTKDLQGDSRLDLTEYDSFLVTHVLQYLYTGSYTFPLAPPDFSLPLHISIFTISISLQIPGLESLSAKNFRDCLSNHVSDLDTYFNAIASVYERTTRHHPGLRNAVIEAAVCELRKILGEGAVKDRFLEVLSKQGEFLGDLLRAMISAREVETEVQIVCDDCGPSEEVYQRVVVCKGCGALKLLEFL
ncbi:hypothetical protein BP5796_10001 [Coleophoma crateriformis]|uniref:BTB domain-containing protein n=1 Tax=Coleophoma crateriformis TaxID=565419 RepID=A0A3D8QU39_9HELO|nr:hypothetical protein BP5796_10001 [Coleophoma crateriformis]